MFLEIWSVTDIIFSHLEIFCPFASLATQKIKTEMKIMPVDIITLHMCTINENHMIVCFLRYGVRWTEFFVILDHFLPFYPPNNPKNQNFEKLKKTPGGIIILHKCTKNHDQMLYCS